MNEPSERDRQEIERIMRKAETLGQDPLRVARALGHAARGPAELQAVQGMKRRFWLTRLLAKRSTAQSRSS